MILTGQDLDFLKQLRAAGERGRTVQTSSIRVALDRLAKGGFVVARPTGLDLSTADRVWDRRISRRNVDITFR